MPNHPSTDREYSDGRRTFVLLLLTLVYAFNFVDRQIIGILSPFIKEDLGLSDGQLGLLKGFLFALFYTVMGIPIAWLADRYNRVKIVAISLAIWSGFTALSGMASNYAQLAFARLGVGIGEAGGSPPSHSIISDLYKKEQRTSALAVYSLGIPLGVMFAFFAAGSLVDLLGWRNTFIALGIPGVLLSLVVFWAIKEPVRGGTDLEKAGEEPAVKPSLWESLSVLLSIPTWWAMCLGIAFASFGSYALSNWGVDYSRRHAPDYDFGTLMNWLGLINGVVYGLGTYLGGLFAERWARSNIRAYGLLPGFALLIATPAFIGQFWVEEVSSFLILHAIFLAAAGTYLGPSFSMAQTLAPVSVRAMSTALFFLVLNLIALGGGPTYVGFMSEMWTPEHGDTHSLRLAMTTLVVPFGLAMISFFAAAWFLPKNWAEAEERNRGSEA